MEIQFGSPSQRKNKQLVENVQRRVTKLVPEIRDLRYADRLEALNLPTLEYMRKRGDLIQMFKFKIIHRLDGFDISTLVSFNDNTTRGQTLRLKQVPMAIIRTKYSPVTKPLIHERYQTIHPRPNLSSVTKSIIRDPNRSPVTKPFTHDKPFTRDQTVHPRPTVTKPFTGDLTVHR